MGLSAFELYIRHHHDSYVFVLFGLPRIAPQQRQKVMRMIDHSMIYPMIAGTITPFALLVIKPVKPVLGWVIFAVAWVVVATMIPLTLTILKRQRE